MPLVTMLTFETGPRPRAGAILFHGGALVQGSPDDLAPHCRRLAEHGIFTVSAGYRLLGQGAASIEDCLSDVRKAIEQFEQTTAALGLDPARLATGGSSAGAHLALLAAMTDARPRIGAIAALNPAGIDLAALEPEQRSRLEERVGIGAGRLADYSIIEHVRPDRPPTLIQHGTEDEIQPIDEVRRFREATVRAGNDCTVVEYPGAKHGFHYPDGGYFEEVMEVTARFLLDRLDPADAGPR